MLSDVVKSYLVHYGYVETLQAVEEQNDLTSKQLEHVYQNGLTNGDVVMDDESKLVDSERK